MKKANVIEMYKYMEKRRMNNNNNIKQQKKALKIWKVC